MTTHSAPKCCDMPMEKMAKDFWWSGVSRLPLSLVFKTDLDAFYQKGDMSVQREAERAALGYAPTFYGCRKCGHVEIRIEERY